MFAEQLKQARTALGMTQQALSDWLEVPKRTIQDWEGEKRTPPAYVQKLILNALSVEANWKPASTEPIPTYEVHTADLFPDQKKHE